MDMITDSIEQKPLPWSFWPTIVLSIIFMIIEVIVANTLIYCGRFCDVGIDAMISDGLFLSTATMLSALVTIALVSLFVKIRKISISEYLCLYRLRGRQYLLWLLALLVFALLSDRLSIFLGKPIILDSMIKAYKTAFFMPFFLLAIIIFAPIGEEIVFRGFLFKGVQNTKLGGIGAIFITSLGWAAMHLQYDLYGIATIFVSGLFLGWARLKTNSINSTIFIHCVWNLIALIETAFYANLG